nr:hypothetical protein B0A51_07835 [Rachicladosporium sp. CCFEE 5018]
MSLNIVHPYVTKKHSSSSSLRHTHVEHVDDLAPLSRGSRPGSEGSITPTVECPSIRHAERAHFASAVDQAVDLDPTPRADSAVILIEEPESGPGWNADDAAFEQIGTTTTLLIGSSRKRHDIPTQTLKAASPFFAQLLATHDKSEPVRFADVEEFTFKVWMQYLYTGAFGNLTGAGAEDFHALTHYLGVYCLSKRWMMEELGNKVFLPESEPEPEEEIAQNDGTADSRPASKPTQRSPARLIPAGMDDFLPQPALRGLFHKKVSPLYDPVPFGAGQIPATRRQRPQTHFLGGQQDGSPSAKSSKDGLTQKGSTSATPSRKPSRTDVTTTESKAATPAQKQSQIDPTKAESSSGTPPRKPSRTDLKPTDPVLAIFARKQSQANLAKTESSSSTPTRNPSQGDLQRIDSLSAVPARKQSQPQVPPTTSGSTSQPSEPVPQSLRRSLTIPRTNPLPSAPLTTKIQPKTPPERSPTATPGPRRPSQTPCPSPHASDSPLVPATPVTKSHRSRNQDCVCTLLGYPPCDNHIAITRWCDCTSASHHTPAAVEAGRSDSCKSVSDCSEGRRKNSKGKEAVQWGGVDAALEETDGEECGGQVAVKGVARKLGCGGDN